MILIIAMISIMINMIVVIELVNIAMDTVTMAVVLRLVVLSTWLYKER